jgi:putative hydrolase of the HAD superfamily
MTYILFDLFHTLVHGGDDDRDLVVTRMAPILGVDPGNLVRAYHESWPERVIARDLHATVHDLAVRVGGSPTSEQVARAARLRHDLVRRLLDAASPHTLACLESLRGQGHRLALVSNATAEAAAAWPASPLARHFAAVAFSCEVGIAKPAAEIYQHAVRAVGAPSASACVFVGDGGDGELAAAAALGMTVIRTTEHTTPTRAGRARPSPRCGTCTRCWAAPSASGVGGAAGPRRTPRR